MTQADIDSDKLIRYWIQGAQHDLAAAREILEKTPRYVNALFFLHLAVEKILKAYHVSVKREHAPFAHNLLFLVQASDLAIDDRQRELLAQINEFNLECRYPDEKYSIYRKATREFTDVFVQEGEHFIAWISAKLK